MFRHLLRGRCGDGRRRVRLDLRCGPGSGRLRGGRPRGGGGPDSGLAADPSRGPPTSHRTGTRSFRLRSRRDRRLRLGLHRLGPHRPAPHRSGLHRLGPHRPGLRGLGLDGRRFRHLHRLGRPRRFQQPVAFCSSPHPVGLRLDDARRMRLDSDAERDAEIERPLIRQSELLGELVDADLAWQRVPPFRESGRRDRPARDRSPGPTATLVEA